MMVTVTKPC